MHHSGKTIPYLSRYNLVDILKAQTLPNDFFFVVIFNLQKIESGRQQQSASCLVFWWENVGGLNEAAVTWVSRSIAQGGKYHRFVPCNWPSVKMPWGGGGEKYSHT